MTTHSSHNRHKSLSLVEFEPTMSAGERPQTYALDRAVTGTGLLPCILHKTAKRQNYPICMIHNFSVYVKPPTEHQVCYHIFFFKDLVPVYSFLLWHQREMHLPFKSYNWGYSSCLAETLDVCGGSSNLTVLSHQTYHFRNPLHRATFWKKILCGVVNKNSLNRPNCCSTLKQHTLLANLWH